jgi:hypothetical protein
MREQNDWRLTNQLAFLKGAALRWQPYHRYRDDWEHDHCECCWAKFAEPGMPESLHEGFVTQDEDRSVCKRCFDDFVELFLWRVVPEHAV